jgi:integrase
MLPVAQFLEKLKAEKAAPRTIAWYRNPLQKFARCCPKKLNRITADDVYRFRDTISHPYTQHNALRAVKKFLKANGIDLGIKMPNFTEPEPTEYQPEELTTLFAAANEWEKHLFSFYLFTGCREQEVSHATWDCLTNMHFVVRAHLEWNWNPKKFKSRFVPVPDTLVKMMEPVRGSGLIFPNIHRRPDGHHLKKLKLLAKRSGQDPDNFTLHKFRRTFATTHLRNGATIHEVAGWLGHKDLDTVLRYLSLASTQNTRVRSLANSAFSFLYPPRTFGGRVDVLQNIFSGGGVNILQKNHQENFGG